MAKYNYWHVVTKVSKAWKKIHPEFKIGIVITHSHKKDNEGVLMFNMKEGKEYPSAYTLSYLGRVLKGLSGDDLVTPLNKFIDEKGFRKIVDKQNDAVEKNDERGGQ